MALTLLGVVAAECDLDVIITVSEDVGQFRGVLCGRAIVVPYTPPQ